MSTRPGISFEPAGIEVFAAPSTFGAGGRGLYGRKTVNTRAHFIEKSEALFKRESRPWPRFGWLHADKLARRHQMNVAPRPDAIRLCNGFWNGDLKF
ncbi:MAG: hypothetical protein A3F90_13605 [Deltaproteobacteria bacterium RIFCSPLOWO2_12_FULL_60_19]|nr:MAG: hypothetical protein A3F90_13605 [Deltaproteobacteria bacterium RIFCSPLOWO2_12_FULL_60_19]